MNTYYYLIISLLCWLKQFLMWFYRKLGDVVTVYDREISSDSSVPLVGNVTCGCRRRAGRRQPRRLQPLRRAAGAAETPRYWPHHTSSTHPGWLKWKLNTIWSKVKSCLESNASWLVNLTHVHTSDNSLEMIIWYWHIVRNEQLQNKFQPAQAIKFLLLSNLI